MEQIWAPWRGKFVATAKYEGCIFCELPKADKDREMLILHRGQEAFVVMNAYPYSAGHLMVTPFRHVASLESLSPGERREIFELLAKCETVLTAAVKPEGFNIGLNLGRAAGAGADKHLHCHIVPRWVGDTNFMPVLADTRVINESLVETYDKLKEYFK